MSTSNGETAPAFGRAERRFQMLLAVVMVVVAVVAVVITWEPGDAPPPYDGIESGLVFAHCDEPAVALFRSSIELWGVDPETGVTTEHTAVDLPEQSRLTYPCGTVGGLARRLFDANYEHAVVQIRTPRTGAEQVHLVSLVGDEHRQLTPDPESPFAPHPHNELAVFGPDGRTVWYRATNDGMVYALDVALLERTAVDTDTDDGTPMTTLDADAVAFVVVDERDGEIFAQRDPTSEIYARDLALPNPRGDLAMGDRTLHTTAAEGLERLTCAGTGEASVAACVQAAVGGDGVIRPAAWLDDQTLLAIYGSDRGANTVLRLEIDDLGRLRVCPALPPSDWTHQAVVVAPDGASFVTSAVRDGTRMLFRQPADVGVEDLPTPLPPPDVPGAAQLIGWQPGATDRPMVPHICGADVAG